MIFFIVDTRIAYILEGFSVFMQKKKVLKTKSSIVKKSFVLEDIYEE